jgi:hypothetical protein
VLSVTFGEGNKTEIVYTSRGRDNSDKRQKTNFSITEKGTILQEAEM